MKPRDYCCCAIPVVNVGIYLTLIEQFALGIIAGTLSVATPESRFPPIPSNFSLILATQSSVLQLLHLHVGFSP